MKIINKIKCWFGFHKWKFYHQGLWQYSDEWKACEHCHKRVDIIIAEI